ncbi:MAG: TetR/AcrR family transcriptional regulator [Xanthobacteraceae bacterium]|nr:TetR/AcrR family transcriptional regulator [Xanthobacteraceae bacterium]
MRISKEEAAANRAKVLAAAARLFREKGVDGIAVAELMQAAGLTHGGFYNHFESKEELAAAAFREAFVAAVGRVERQAAEAGKGGRDSAFAHYVSRYLARETRDAPGASCPMATLGTDAARHGAELKAAFAEGVRQYIEAFAKIMPGEASEQRVEAITVLSTLIGALTLSRACVGADDALADEVIATVRDRLLADSGKPSPRRSARRT